MFAEVQSAYEVLSDPQERAWYDSHESAILRGADPADQHYEHDVKVTTADDLTRLTRRFNSRVAYSDAPDGFFGFLRDTFDTLAREESVAASWDGVEAVEYPSFGRSDDAYDEVVRAFYAAWAGFSTKKSFAWKDIYRYSDAPDRRTRRYMEKENGRLREEGIREFNDAVRNFVAFVRKRDPRWAPNTQSEEQRQKALKEMRDAQAARARAEREALMQEDVPEWTKTRDPEELEESEEEEIEEEHFECVACNKTFKSEKQWEAHEKSKKHQKAVYALQKKMRKENKNLNLDEDVPSSGIATPDTAEEEETLVDEDEPIDEEQTKTVEDEQLGDTDQLEDEEAKGKQESATKADKSQLSDSDDDASDDDYVPRSKLESRLAAASLSDKEDEDSQLNSTLVSDERPAAAGGPKLGKAAQKRAKKAAKQAVADEEELKFKCAVCEAGYPSKTRLFQHIKDNGHAAPVSLAKGSGGGGGKGKKKGKR